MPLNETPHENFLRTPLLTDHMRPASLSPWSRPFDKLKKKCKSPSIVLDCKPRFTLEQIQYTLFQFFLPSLSCATCSESVLFLPKIDNDFWWCCAVEHLRGNIVHRCLFHKFHCDCFCSDVEGVQNKVMFTNWNNLMNVASTWRLRVGFAYRLFRFKPRASRFKVAPTNCGTHRVNGGI